MCYYSLVIVPKWVLFFLVSLAALAAPMDSKHVDERLQRLCADIEVRVLYFVGRALVKGDRAMFALHLARGMHGTPQPTLI